MPVSRLPARHRTTSQRPPDCGGGRSRRNGVRRGLRTLERSNGQYRRFFGETSRDADELLCAEFSAKPTCVWRIRIYRIDVATIQVLRRRLGSLAWLDL